ncbi:hypothetical protein DBR11_07375 [Pedobacter sp. HMWF019]|nr:hypothetical protein DBR11_07375 [Pedobacter sp. HMWF019]
MPEWAILLPVLDTSIKCSRVSEKSGFIVSRNHQKISVKSMRKDYATPLYLDMEFFLITWYCTILKMSTINKTWTLKRH